MANSSSSDRLLAALRKLEFDNTEGRGLLFYECDYVAGRLSDVNSVLAEQWREVGNFLDKVTEALEVALREVRNEVEIYAQSSVAIEDELVSVVREVYEACETLLKEINLINN